MSPLAIAPPAYSGCSRLRSQRVRGRAPVCAAAAAKTPLVRLACPRVPACAAEPPPRLP